MKPIIVKLGGSVITDKRKPFTVRKSVLGRLAKELSDARGPLVVVHGGGSFGHTVAAKYNIAKGYRSRKQLMGLSLTHRSMERLNAQVVEALQGAGLPAVAVQPSACAVVSNGRIVSMELRPVRKMLELGIVPVLYGDAVTDAKKGMCILSGDQLMSRLASELGASRVIVGADVDGVFTSNPKKDRGARHLDRITPSTKLSLGGAGVKDVTGGMKNKVDELMALARIGIESEIANAMRPGVMKKLVSGGRGLGTIIGGSR
ncbi:MAG: isopentenyl phosphate kinase [Candidatus Hadarchaeota archaeon]